MNFVPRSSGAILIALMAIGLSACSSGAGGGSALPPPMTTDSNTSGGPTPMVDTDTAVEPADAEDGASVLKRLNTTTTIGSTVDPLNGDQNPYGLDIAKSDAGLLMRGDLVVCNFNNAANVQGTGTTIIALKPHAGATPKRIAQSAVLDGCDEIALAPNDTIWASAFSANDNPILTPGGSLITTLPGGPWHGPFGQTFSPHAGPFGKAAFYESNASDGSIVRINITSSGFTFDVIATGFAVNHGVPGSILGPSGLQYDAVHDRLYIVDGANNTVVAFRHVSTIPAGGIVVSGATFSGPFRHRARTVFSGPPLNGPISSALLADGHLVIGNTLDPTGQNLMVEITSSGKLLDVRNVDTGAGAALFGMVASRSDDQGTRVYFNDDNDNTVKVLSP